MKAIRYGLVFKKIGENRTLEELAKMSESDDSVTRVIMMPEDVMDLDPEAAAADVLALMLAQGGHEYPVPAGMLFLKGDKEDQGDMVFIPDVEFRRAWLPEFDNLSLPDTIGKLRFFLPAIHTIAQRIRDVMILKEGEGNAQEVIETTEKK